MNYRLFVSMEYDWWVLAKIDRKKKKVKVLYRGHNRDQAYEAWLEDLNVKPNALICEVDMSSGDYEPTVKDF